MAFKDILTGDDNHMISLCAFHRTFHSRCFQLNDHFNLNAIDLSFINKLFFI